MLMLYMCVPQILHVSGLFSIKIIFLFDKPSQNYFFALNSINEPLSNPEKMVTGSSTFITFSM